MTEEDARTKECPQHMILMAMIQITAAENNKPSLIAESNSIGLCSASNCMMWESWEYEGANDNGVRETKNKGCGDCGLKTKELECRGGF